MKNLVDNLIERHLKLNAELNNLSNALRSSNEYGGNLQQDVKEAIAQYDAIKGMITISR